MRSYDHKKIEKKWQQFWQKNKIYTTPDKAPGKDNFYLLVEFPYPSGNLHVGHWYAFAVPDILARAMRMQGKNVLYPIGFDAFGLPAENAAIKNKLNPRKWTLGNIEYMKKQIASMGASFDWSREVVTCDPAYYQWTQWLFLQFFKKGLAYQKETAVNWCPKDKTVLANEQVIDGKCDRCGTEVIQREMLQWNIKITDYADRLVDDLKPLDWPEQIKQSQRNWIGRSEGAEIDFPLNIDTDVKRFVVVHCKGETPEGIYYPWLKKALEARGYEVQIPTLPNPNEPNDEEQADYVEKHCTLDEHTALIGHSFGGIVALRLLERGHTVQRVTLAAVPYSGKFIDGKKRPTVAAACKKGFDFDTIRKHSKGFIVLPDSIDHIVPMSDAETFAEKLDGVLVRGRGEKPHFQGDREPDILMAAIPTIRVFTTRADTLYGATYLVLAPEHPWVTRALLDTHDVLENKAEVRNYVEAARKKTELEREKDQKEKTGVELKGVKAIHPATHGELPIYVADYVLGTYGTGAIMAVPAHDDRDGVFAKKFGIPVTEVVEPFFVQTSGEDAVNPAFPMNERNAVEVILKHWSEDKYLCLQLKSRDVRGFITGGIEAGEGALAAAAREIHEETGYKNPRFIRNLGGKIHAKFSHPAKDENIFAHFTPMLFELADGEQDEVAQREKDMHEAHWVEVNKVANFINRDDILTAWRRYRGESTYTGEGLLTNSFRFTGMPTAEARIAIAEEYGRKKTTFKMRDWIVSRQRYWGVPIPVIHCPACGIVPVPDKDLPVKLPEVKDYLPEGSGKSPLAKVKKWVNVKCPNCKGKAERETDTFDTFVDSSWYYLRYTDPKNKKKFADAKKMDAWMPVNLYSGGAEHTTMHVLYSRFWQKALYDLKLVKDPEPYMRRMNRSLILGPDGQKMSKSRGNVIDPDEVVKQLGADTVRMYLAFIGPYNEVANYPWNPDGVVGVRRFLERVWRLSEKVSKKSESGGGATLHKTIKKVGEDIQALKFNTAISQMMILLNSLEKAEQIGIQEWELLLKLLAPFAPHMTEELWHELGHKTSIHKEKWPAFDANLLQDESVTYAIQVDGKTRGEVTLERSADEASVKNAAREAVAARLEGKKIVREIVVPGRLVNFVLEK